MDDAPTRRRAPVAALCVAATAAAFLAALAFQGGAYDVVARQTAGVLLWWAVLVGTLVFARSLRWPAAPAIAATAFGAGIAIWAGLGADASLSAERSATETARAVAHLAPIILVGWVLPKHLWRAVVVGVAVGGTVVCLAALGERLSPGFLEDTRTVVFLNTTSRIAAPLGYWNALGSWGVITAVLLLAMSSHLPRPAFRAMAALPLPAIAAVIYLTYSRSALASGLLGLVLLVAFSRNRWTVIAHLAAFGVAAVVVIQAISGADQIANATGNAGAGGVILAIAASALALAAIAALTGHLRLDAVRVPRKPAKAAFAIGAALGAAVLIFGVATYGGQAWDRFSTQENADAADPTARLTMVNNGNRVVQWQVAWDSWEAQPWRGSGAGTFELTYNREGNDGQFVRDAHSSYLESLSEQGIPGFALLVGLVFSSLWTLSLALRRASSTLDRGLIAGAGAALGAFFIGSGADWFWEVGALAMLSMTLLGALMASLGQDAAATPAQRPHGRGLLLPAMLVAVALAAVLVELPGLVGTSEIRRSQQAVVSGDLNAAREHADQAIDTMPWASSPFLQRGLVDEQTGAWPSARRSLQLAIARDPYDWRLPLVLSRIEAKAGEPAAALEAYRDAKALRPRGEFFR